MPSLRKTGVKSPSSKSESLLKNDEKREKARWYRIKKTYGITEEQYKELDHGHCPVCLRVWSERVRPAVDHDHIDGWVRGILCLYCNRTRVGRFRDYELVQRIADYLRGPFEHVVPPKKKRRKKKT